MRRRLVAFVVDSTFARSQATHRKRGPSRRLARTGLAHWALKLWPGVVSPYATFSAHQSHSKQRAVDTLAPLLPHSIPNDVAWFKGTRCGRFMLGAFFNQTETNVPKGTQSAWSNIVAQCCSRAIRACAAGNWVYYGNQKVAAFNRRTIL